MNIKILKKYIYIYKGLSRKIHSGSLDASSIGGLRESDGRLESSFSAVKSFCSRPLLRAIHFWWARASVCRRALEIRRPALFDPRNLKESKGPRRRAAQTLSSGRKIPPAQNETLRNMSTLKFKKKQKNTIQAQNKYHLAAQYISTLL